MKVHRQMIFLLIVFASKFRLIEREISYIYIYVLLNARYPCLVTARTLLQCGADVNAADISQNTPLHIFLLNSFTHNENIVKLLCDNGAHVDYVNNLRETVIDIAPNATIKQLLKSKRKIYLKCICARIIQENKILFHGKVSTLLGRFIEKH